MHHELQTKGLLLEDLPFLLANVKQSKVHDPQPFPNRMERKCLLVCGCRCYRRACHCGCSSKFLSPSLEPLNWTSWPVSLVRLVIIFQRQTIIVEVLPWSILMLSVLHDPLVSFPNWLTASCHLHSSPLSLPVWSKDSVSLALNPKSYHY